MAITVKNNWLRTVDGNWINANHVDLFEVVNAEVRDNNNSWRVVAWNALQPQVEAYILAVAPDEAAARSLLDRLIESLNV